MFKIEKDIMIILGNGISIDLVNKLEMVDKINLSNLFSNGDKVRWPGNNEPGFLSQQWCPALWELGARPGISNGKTSKIIEDVITCANVSASSEHPSIDGESSNIYIKAYHELVLYLRYLFIFYNNEIKDDCINKLINNEWGWSKLFENINKNSKVKNVIIITYNYDIFLERILKALKIKYQMIGFDNIESKFKIIKPHGSISFRTEKLNNKQTFGIKYNRDSIGGELKDLIIDEDVDFEKISKLNSMIPPSGESDRYKMSWSNILREKSIEYAKQLMEDDEVIFGGISYCNVDRREIDGIITALNVNTNIKVVNPDCDNTLGAVISSVFNNYIHYTKSEMLGGLFND